MMAIPRPPSENLSRSPISRAMAAALTEAEKFRGATSPNPPVGAAALDSEGNILAVGAHERAGTAHAEAKVLEACRLLGILSKVKTLVVTLEPCNHQGRTPPCTGAILSAGAIERVVIGARDPNPKVKGGGSAFLSKAGIQVDFIEDEAPDLALQCARLIGPFRKWITTGLPWVTVKRALQADGSMIPPPGQKTFTSKASLDFAHELRKRADAILTGSGTVLADLPEFTVRRVPDHPGKTRLLVVLDRRNRVPREWVSVAQSRGFEVVEGLELEKALEFLGSRGCLEVLVEAGPGLTEAILKGGFWDEDVVIRQVSKTDDQRETRLRCSQELLKKSDP